MVAYSRTVGVSIAAMSSLVCSGCRVRPYAFFFRHFVLPAFGCVVWVLLHHGEHISYMKGLKEYRNAQRLVEMHLGCQHDDLRDGQEAFSPLVAKVRKNF